MRKFLQKCRKKIKDFFIRWLLKSMRRKTRRGWSLGDFSSNDSPRWNSFGMCYWCCFRWSLVWCRDCDWLCNQPWPQWDRDTIRPSSSTSTKYFQHFSKDFLLRWKHHFWYWRWLDPDPVQKGCDFGQCRKGCYCCRDENFNSRNGVVPKGSNPGHLGFQLLESVLVGFDSDPTVD